MAMQAKYGARMANQMALDHWAAEYVGDLGIMLPDTLTTPIFLKTLTRRDAKLYDGVRLDSGDLKAAAAMVIQRYGELDVDSKDKILLPSDALTYSSAINFHNTFKDQVKGITAGIGTHLTNDVLSSTFVWAGFGPLNMVIKMVEAEFGFGPVKVVKLSDNPGKHTGDPEQIQHVKRELGLA